MPSLVHPVPGALPPPDVHVDDVDKSYPGVARPVLDRLSARCPAGLITVIVGASGCGKTTLLRCICGLETVDSGAIRFGDTNVTRIDAEKRGVAMVFQNYALYPSKTVAENIAFPLRMAGVAAAERMPRIRAAASLVRIESLLDRLPAQLSGGQRQRVGIARAIVRGPRVLLMDEPLSNLDTKLRMDMRAELAALQREIGATTVYVTHDQTEALALADHLIVLRDGVVEQDGPPELIFQAPASTYVADFLGHMNLTRGAIDGKAFKPTDGGEMTLPRTKSEARAGERILGFRAEEIRIGAPDPDHLAFTADVVRAELLGSESLVHLSVGAAALRARLSGPIKVGDRLPLLVEASRIHYFDVDSGRRIAGTELPT